MRPLGRGRGSGASTRSAAGLVLLAAAGLAAAQVPPGALEQRRPSDRPPPPQLAPAPPAPLTLPPIPPAPGDALSSGLEIRVSRFEFSGNTVIATETLEALAAPYRERPIGNEQLDELRRKVTAAYVERGYINSGAVIPDQRIGEGVVRVHVVEGTLDEIEVRGSEHLDPRYVEARLRLAAGPPLNVAELQDRLQVLVASPHLERVNADLRPGDRPGQARLSVEVEERRPYDFAVVLDNRASASVGGEQGRAVGTLRNLLGRGDTLSTELALAEGLTDVSFAYALPLDARDTTLGLFVQVSDADVVEEPFDAIGVESEAATYGLSVSRPFLQTSRRRLSLSLAFERRMSQTFLLGRPFPFSLGVEPDGESHVTAVRFAQDWLSQDLFQVLAVRSTFTAGLDALGATEDPSGVDGKFLAWLGQVQWVRRLEATGGQLLVRGDLQLANDPLLSLEQFAIGGARSVRGYRETQRIADNGYSASIEYRHPVRSDDLGRTRLQLAAFFDIGDTWNSERDTPDSRYLSSIGLGVLWDPHPKVHAELYWGVPLRDVGNPANDLQDSGIHFALTLLPFD